MGILHCHALLCCTTIIACQTNTLAKHPRYSYVPRQSSISIYTFSDLGDLSNLIGALSRTIQQYSPLSEWIMCELGFFPIPLENALLKVDKILGLTIFLSKERLRRIQNSVFPFTVTEFCGRWIVYNSCLFA